MVKRLEMEVATAEQRAASLEKERQELVAEIATVREDAEGALVAANVEHVTVLKRIQVRNL